MPNCKATCSSTQKIDTDSLKKSQNDKQTSTTDLPLNSITISCNSCNSTNFYEELTLFVELSLRIMGYVKEQVEKLGSKENKDALEAEESKNISSACVESCGVETTISDVSFDPAKDESYFDDETHQTIFDDTEMTSYASLPPVPPPPPSPVYSGYQKKFGSRTQESCNCTPKEYYAPLVLNSNRTDSLKNSARSFSNSPSRCSSSFRSRQNVSQKNRPASLATTSRERNVSWRQPVGNVGTQCSIGTYESFAELLDTEETDPLEQDLNNDSDFNQTSYAPFECRNFECLLRSPPLTNQQSVNRTVGNISPTKPSKSTPLKRRYFENRRF